MQQNGFPIVIATSTGIIRPRWKRPSARRKARERNGSPSHLTLVRKMPLLVKVFSYIVWVRGDSQRSQLVRDQNEERLRHVAPDCARAAYPPAMMRWHDVRLFSVPAWYGSGVTFEGVAKYIGSELAVDLRRGTQSSQKTKREALRYIITRQEQTRLATDGHRLSCHFKGLPKWTQGHLVNCQYGTMGHIETSG